MPKMCDSAEEQQLAFVWEANGGRRLLVGTAKNVGGRFGSYDPLKRHRPISKTSVNPNPFSYFL